MTCKLPNVNRCEPFPLLFSQQFCHPEAFHTNTLLQPADIIAHCNKLQNFQLFRLFALVYNIPLHSEIFLPSDSPNYTLVTFLSHPTAKLLS
jgi:hypothetical protein